MNSHPKDDPNDGRHTSRPAAAHQSASSSHQQGTADDLQSLKSQLAELTNALQRERADATNMRRRHEEQIRTLREAVKADVVRELLPVIDNFERALKHVPAEQQNDPYVKGVQGLVKQFEKSLTDLGVTRIATAGQPFDPRYHEAVSAEEGGGSREVVSEELQAGYQLGDEVIRHAMVRVKLV